MWDSKTIGQFLHLFLSQQIFFQAEEAPGDTCRKRYNMRTREKQHVRMSNSSEEENDSVPPPPQKKTTANKDSRKSFYTLKEYNCKLPTCTWYSDVHIELAVPGNYHYIEGQLFVMMPFFAAISFSFITTYNVHSGRNNYHSVPGKRPLPG